MSDYEIIRKLDDEVAELRYIVERIIENPMIRKDLIARKIIKPKEEN